MGKGIKKVRRILTAFNIIPIIVAVVSCILTAAAVAVTLYYNSHYTNSLFDPLEVSQTEKQYVEADMVSQTLATKGNASFRIVMDEEGKMSFIKIKDKADANVDALAAFSYGETDEDPGNITFTGISTDFSSLSDEEFQVIKNVACDFLDTDISENFSDYFGNSYLDCVQMLSKVKLSLYIAISLGIVSIMSVLFLIICISNDNKVIKNLRKYMDNDVDIDFDEDIQEFCEIFRKYKVIVTKNYFIAAALMPVVFKRNETDSTGFETVNGLLGRKHKELYVFMKNNQRYNITLAGSKDECSKLIDLLHSDKER